MIPPAPPIGMPSVIGAVPAGPGPEGGTLGDALKMRALDARSSSRADPPDGASRILKVREMLMALSTIPSQSPPSARPRACLITPMNWGRVSPLSSPA